MSPHTAPNPKPPVHSQFLFFALVGAAGTLVHYASMILLIQGFSVEPVLSTTIGAAFGAVVNYRLNHVLTFRSVRPHIQAAPRFLIVAVASLIMNGAMFTLFLHAFALHYVVAQLVATAAVLALNFAISRWWVF